MKLKHKIITVVTVVALIFSVACVSASAYGMSENRTDMPNLTNRDLLRLNDLDIIVFGELGSNYLDLALPRWAKRDYYGNGRFDIQSYRDGSYDTLYYIFNIYYNDNSPYSESYLTYTRNDAYDTFTQVNGIDIHCKELFHHSNESSEYYDSLTFPFSIDYLSSASINYKIFDNGELVTKSFICPTFDSGDSFSVDIRPSDLSLSEDVILYDVSVRIFFNQPMTLDNLTISNVYVIESEYERILDNSIDSIKKSYNPVPEYSDIWELFASAVEAFFAVKIFDTISLGSIILVVVGVFLFRLVLKVFAGD